MDPLLTDLLQLLELEQLEDNLFRGTSRDIGSNRVFGGQVLGQALRAATRTVQGRNAHSLHAYFLRAGDTEAPIVYDVDRSRDGKSFSVRRVVAIQHGRPIFNLAASFQRVEEGLDHQSRMPDVPGPEGLRDAAEYYRDMQDQVPEKMQRFLTHARPFEFRPLQAPDLTRSEALPPRTETWFRTVDRLPPDGELHRCLLAYVSDYGLLRTATLPHGISFLDGNVQMASLDHAMWFHRDASVDQWLLYVCDSPSASGARGYARGEVFTRDGRLVASMSQEGLIRLWLSQD